MQSILVRKLSCVAVDQFVTVCKIFSTLLSKSMSTMDNKIKITNEVLRVSADVWERAYTSNDGIDGNT